MTDIATRPISEEEAARFRSQFPVFEYTTYLNSCSLGPLSTQAEAALQEYRDDWSRYGAPAWWQAWIPRLQAAKERFAGLIGAGAHEVTVSHSVSSALSIIASTFDYGARPGVVLSDLDFPTINYQWLAKQRLGVEVRMARSQDRIRVPLEEYERAMDERVAHIATSHIFYATSYVQPIRKLADLAHAHGAKVIVDGYHSVGVIPVDVKALDVDFYVGGTLKWLMGGPGLTFIYVREELIEQLQPTITGWFASANQFAFDSENLSFAPTADRLEFGTPAVGTAYSGVAGMDMIREADPERIWPRIQQLTDRVVERAKRAGYGIASPEDGRERGGVVMLRLREPEETVNQVATRGFTVDYRPGLLRVSPHFFNTMDDVDRLMDQIEDIQRSL